ncbi:MAG: hypothetical protein QOF29_2432 [bacterium]|jgi:hypothetical protein
MRLVPLVRAVVVACLLLAAPATPAAAAGEPLVLSGPVDGAELSVGSSVALHARSATGESGLELRVSASSQPVDACGRIAADVAQASGAPLVGDPALYDFATGPWHQRAGTYYWQVSRVASDGTCAATEVRRLVMTAVAEPAPGLGGATALSRERVPSRIGASNGTSYTIRTSVPRGISRARFVALVRNSGRRWRLHSLGTLPGRPVFGNGRSEVGFSTPQVPRHALGVTITGPVFRAGRAVSFERDLILRGDLPWQQGPARPARFEIDLETVLLHEFGHVAGNRRHVARGCSDTPMVVGLAGGEWWRSTGDFSFRACGGSTA